MIRSEGIQVIRAGVTPAVTVTAIPKGCLNQCSALARQPECPLARPVKSESNLPVSVKSTVTVTVIMGPGSKSLARRPESS